MNVLFLTLEDIDSYQDKDMYAEVMREFIERGHTVHTISPLPGGRDKTSRLNREGDNTILRLATDNTQGAKNLIKKGLSTLLIGHRFSAAIKRYYKDIVFDLILYSTPPITFVSTVKYVKKRDGAKTYLMLKDIFPQNAEDLQMFPRMLAFLLHMYFRAKEKKLYRISDYIGCMSNANVQYLLSHNAISANRVNVCPNSLSLQTTESQTDRNEVRKTYGIPQDSVVFVYGGNLGKPQGADFIVRCMKRFQTDVPDAFLLIVGKGTEYARILRCAQGLERVRVLPALPVAKYSELVHACDVGLIFLDYRFTIPNYPSRLLSYTSVGLPVLCATDPISDIGKDAEQNGFGWQCSSNDVEEFVSLARSIAHRNDLAECGEKAREYHREHYLPVHSYRAIAERVLGDESLTD